MKRQALQRVLACGVITVVSLVAAMAVLAQGPPGNPQLTAPKGAKGKAKAEPTPHLPDGTPDLAGVWMGFGSNSGDISKGLKKGDEVVMLDWAADLFKKRQAKEDPQGNCLPSGIPRGNPYPWRFVQDRTHKAAERIYVLYEGNIHSFRQIFMDGRPHPEDPDPTWWGHSIGKWDGDTLVVDTVGFNDLFWFDFLGHPHTEKLHTVERYRRTDMNTLEIEVTIDDPGAYKKPFTTVGRARLMPGDELAEYICQENNSDLSHIVGAAQVP